MNRGPYGDGNEHDEQRKQHPSRHEHDGIVPSEGVHEVRLDLYPRHLVAGVERRREYIVQAGGIGAHKNDLVAKQSRMDLTAQNSIVRHQRVAAVGTAIRSILLCFATRSFLWAP